MNVSVEKNVILIKYGKTHPANKVSNDEFIFGLNTAIWLADPPGENFGYTW